MTNQTKEVKYNFEASEFKWEIAPGKNIKHGDSIINFPAR